MISITRCPTCGSRNIAKVRKNLRRAYRGRAYTIPDVEFYGCPNCGEKVYPPAAMRKIEAYSPAYEHARPRRQARAS